MRKDMKTLERRLKMGATARKVMIMGKEECRERTLEHSETAKELPDSINKEAQGSN